jgi:hypothetical protein
MAYTFIPGTEATYLDGSFSEPTSSSQPKILIMGSADSGRSLEIFNVTNVRQAESEFGADTDVLRGVHETVAQGSDNVAIMRVGGTQGALVLTDSNGGTLTITPEYRDDAVLTRYALILDGTGTANRIYVYDLTDEAFVYDSSEILVINSHIVEVVDTGLDLFTVSDPNIPTTFIAMSALNAGGSDFTVENTTTMTSAIATQGTDGKSNSLAQKYAAFNTAYHLLDYKDADFVVPYGVYMDDANQSDGSTPNYFKGVPVAGDSNDALGWVWQYIYQGRLYTYMVDSGTYFSATPAAATLVVATNADISLTADIAGTGGNGISIELLATVGVLTTTISEPAPDTLLISVALGAATTMADVVTDINTELGLFTMANGQLASTLVTATDLAGAPGVATAVASAPLAGGTGGHVLTHTDLTGDSIPAAVSNLFAAQVTALNDVQLREVNFGHQLASFARFASTTWKALIGSISFKAPTAVSRTAVSNWIGSLPEFAKAGIDTVIPDPGSNGTGVLGHKLMVGESDVTGYRNAQIENGTSNDGYAWGGIIQTIGASLPNGSDFAYGILDSDELLDSNRAPVDLGKHLLVSYDWPIHRNAFNGGGNYRGSINALLAGKIAITPVNEEPIGSSRGSVRKVTNSPRVHSTQVDALAQARCIGLRFEEGTGWIIVSAKTAAHPDSDYTRLSTIRSVNRALQGIRSIAKDYIGGAFSSRQLLSLQAAIDSFLVSERGRGFNQGAQAQLSYTRSDKILGRLKIKLAMVPPFAIEKITVETSLAADESEL